MSPPRRLNETLEEACLQSKRCSSCHSDLLSEDTCLELSTEHLVSRVVSSLLKLSEEVCLQSLQCLAAPLHPLCWYAHVAEETCWKLLASPQTVWDRQVWKSERLCRRVQGHSDYAPSRTTLPLPSLSEALLLPNTVPEGPGWFSLPHCLLQQ